MQDFEEMSDPTLQQNVSQASNPAGFPAGRGANMPCGQGFRSATERTAARAAVGSVVNVTSGNADYFFSGAGAWPGSGRARSSCPLAPL